MYRCVYASYIKSFTQVVTAELATEASEFALFIFIYICVFIYIYIFVSTYIFIVYISWYTQVVAAELATGASEFALLLNSQMAEEAGKHVEHYLHKGLIVKLENASELARWMLANADGTQLTEFGIYLLLS